MIPGISAADATLTKRRDVGCVSADEGLTRPTFRSEIIDQYFWSVCNEEYIGGNGDGSSTRNSGSQGGAGNDFVGRQQCRKSSRERSVQKEGQAFQAGLPQEGRHEERRQEGAPMFQLMRREG
jgi:hypothetical protein